MKRLFSEVAIALLFVSVLTSFCPRIAPVCAAGTTVAVINVLTGSNVTMAYLHDTFSINVSLENVPQELSGYQFALAWNASILNCTSHTITPPKEWGSNVFIGKDQLNKTNPDGTESYLAAVVSTAFGVSVGPNHVVNTLNFTVTGTGETVLTLEDVMLADPYGGIPVTVFSGLFQTPYALVDRTYSTPYPLTPSVSINLTANQYFRVNPPTLAIPPKSFITVEVFVDIVDPHNQHIVNCTTDFWSYTGFTGGNWTIVCVPTAHICAANTFIEVNYTGTYNFTFSTDPPDTFSHIQILGLNIIPEFPLYLILPFLMMTTLLAVAIYRRKHLDYKSSG